MRYSFALTKVIKTPSNFYAIFSKNDVEFVHVPILTEEGREFIELRTSTGSVWKPHTVLKHGTPLIWNFGDGTGDTLESEHNYRGLEGWKNIRIYADDGMIYIEKLALVNVEPLPDIEYKEYQG